MRKSMCLFASCHCELNTSGNYLWCAATADLPPERRLDHIARLRRQRRQHPLHLVLRRQVAYQVKHMFTGKDCAHWPLRFEAHVTAQHAHEETFESNIADHFCIRGR